MLGVPSNVAAEPACTQVIEGYAWAIMSSDPNCRDGSGLFSVSEARVLQIQQDLQLRGMSILRGAISPSWIATAREEVAAYVERHGSGDHDLFDLDKWECPAMRELAENPEMESMLARLAAQSSSGVVSTGAYDRRALRIHDGTRGVIPYLWHYDANTVTAMIPVTVPDDGSGRFATLPPERPIRRSVTSMVRERIRIGKDPYPGATKQFKKAPDQSTYPLVPGGGTDLLRFPNDAHCAAMARRPVAGKHRSPLWASNQVGERATSYCLRDTRCDKSRL